MLGVGIRQPSYTGYFLLERKDLGQRRKDSGRCYSCDLLKSSRFLNIITILDSFTTIIENGNYKLIKL
jgi:hypothetical protein